jgi:hypothetical protein
VLFLPHFSANTIAGQAGPMRVELLLPQNTERIFPLFKTGNQGVKRRETVFNGVHNVGFRWLPLASHPERIRCR